MISTSNIVMDISTVLLKTLKNERNIIIVHVASQPCSFDSSFVYYCKKRKNFKFSQIC